MSGSAASFDPENLEARYALLGDLPEDLYEPVVTHAHGELLGRVRSVLALRESLLSGTVPNELGLLPPALSARLGESLRAMGLARFCRDEPEVTDAVIRDVLRILTDATGWREGIIGKILDELESRARARRKHDPRGERKRKQREGSSWKEELERKARELEEPALNEPSRVRREAERQADEQVMALAAQTLESIWKERIRIWCELEEVFGPLGQLMGIGWDLSRGLLRSQGWLEVARLRALLERLPALRDLLRALGRMQTSAGPEASSVLEEVIGPMRRVVEERRRVRSPLAPTEMRGIERSGEIGRMLPLEAALLTHPALRMLWHARRAERALLTYRAEGIIEEIVSAERDDARATLQRRELHEERGPILLCVDTSGSMAGVPETVAKAVALEAMRAAHAERRRCIVYLFSGPGDVVEHELSLSTEGLGRLVAFLTTSFHGGTDVAGPLVRAFERLEGEAWRRADVLVVSDGEFPLPPGIARETRRLREEQGVRVHGLLIGSSPSEAMAHLCDPLHRFVEWGALLEER